MFVLTVGEREREGGERGREGEGERKGGRGGGYQRLICHRRLTAGSRALLFSLAFRFLKGRLSDGATNVKK